MAKMNNAQGKTVDYPDREELVTSDIGHGFKVGQTVKFLEDFADDVPAGRHAVITRIDNHPTMPLTVDIHHPDGGFMFGCPVKVSEVVAVEDVEPETDPENDPEPGPEAPAAEAATDADAGTDGDALVAA